MKRWWNLRIETTGLIFSLCLAFFFFFGLNAAIIARLYSISQSESMKAGFVLSLPVFFVSAFNILFLPLSGRRATKPFFVFLVLLSAMISYATYNYGVIFSKEMITNIVETDYAEASSYLNGSVVLWFFFLGVFPAWLICRTTFVPSRRKYLYPLFSAFGSVLMIAIILGLYYQDYAMTIRNYPDLKKTVVPTYALSSGYKFARQKFFVTDMPYQKIGTDATQLASRGKKKNLTVFIIGETARAVNYQFNGYSRETNKYTQPLNVHFYKNVTSCGTETAVSVPCMLSNLTRGGYSLDKAENQDNLMDILKTAGLQLLWIDNNAGCKGTCKNVNFINIRKEYAENSDLCDSAGCLDSALISELEKKLATLKNENTVIVLHLMGSHGPAYYKRYPKNFGEFKPDCRRSDVQNCPAQALTNTYDNTILYTDYVISRVIKVLQGHQEHWDTSMLYVSDHGESLGENGVYLHGLPYSFAPKEQKHVPLITWFSPAYVAKNSLNEKCIQDDAEKKYSHDNIFHTILGLADVSTSAYKKEMDMFAACRIRK
jgi:lipid A ethanolaminephosphotransferase